MGSPFPDWIYRQSAILPFRLAASAPQGRALEVLLISTRNGKRWTLPKGIVEPGMSAAASAMKEAWEEAGVRGPVGRDALGAYSRDKWGGSCRVEVFPMRVEEAADSWPEEGFRKRLWLSPEEAAARLPAPVLGEILAALPDKAANLPLLRLSEPAPRLVYLFRHAKSSWDDPSLDDSARPLAHRGRMASAAMAHYFRIGDIKPELVVCSTALRTRETLAAVLPTFGGRAGVAFDRGLYLTEAARHLELLRSQPDALQSVMLIGHNPGLEDAAEMLIGSGDKAALARLAAKFPTGALAILVYRGARWRDLGPGQCELHSFVVPRDIGQAPSP